MQVQESDTLSSYSMDLRRHLLWLIVFRAVILFIGLNLADSLGLMPPSLIGFPYLPLLNIVTASLTLVYLALWRNGRGLPMQLYLQIGIDLIITTVLVASTGGIESSFISFYLLVITCSSLTLGRNGGMSSAALSTILYAGAITASNLGHITPKSAGMRASLATFRISVHALGFVGVAFLGTQLSKRLRAVQYELAEKTTSLKRLQRLNEHIVSSIRSGLITTDLRGRIAAFNNAAEEITGRKSEEVLDKPVQSILGEGLWSKILMVDLFELDRALRHEDWITLPNGTKRSLGFSVSPLMDQGHQLLGYIVSFQDLTEIKRLEEEVRVKDRMAAVGRMAAAVAHEIRNPLTSIQGSVELLRSRANLPKNDERLLDIVMREGERLNKFVGDFLSFARPARCALSSVDLVPLIQDLAILLRNNSEVRKRYAVILDLAANEISVTGNADRLKQVFWNLSQNALRAMPDGGTLTISAGRSLDGSVQVVVGDCGVGMTREEKAQLFQPFHSGFGGGTGLGLSIVFQIMEDHRGKISIESEKGRGTEVTLYFPAVQQAMKISPAEVHHVMEEAQVPCHD